MATTNDPSLTLRRNRLLLVILLALALINATCISAISTIACCTLGLVLAVVLLFLIQLASPPPLLLLRLALLIIPGTLPPLVLLSYGSDIVVAIHGAKFQNEYYCGIIISLTLAAAIASWLGWSFGDSLVARIGSSPLRSLSLKPVGRQHLFSFAFFGIISFVAARETAKSLGPFIWERAYASAAKAPLLGIGIFPAIAAIGVIALYAEARFLRRWWAYGLFLSVAVYDLVFCLLLRGMRLEVFATVIAIFFLEVDRRRWRLSLVRVLLAGCAAFLLAQTWGTYRSAAVTGLSFFEALTNAPPSIIYYNYSGHLYHLLSLGTVSDITATFFNAIGLHDSGNYDFLWGRSYLEYLPRTLPKFLAPTRPQDLAWLFDVLGFTSGGGMFEPAEAYINFGIVGCIMVPFLLSILFSVATNLALTRFSSFSLRCIGVITMFSFRGIWYQTFSMYKGMITFLLLEGAAAFAVFVAAMMSSVVLYAVRFKNPTERIV